MKTIGLVLPEAPQYSETFFNHKIKGLQESGFEVIVFSGKKAKYDLFFKHRNAYPVYKNRAFKQAAHFVTAMLMTLARCPAKAFKLFSLERKDGKTFSDSIKNVYINAHILPFKLDNLHFGFATMTVKRENVSKAMDAKMSVSFRGYDINVYPLKNPGCYNKLWKTVNNIHSISKHLHSKAIAFGLSKDVPFEIITPAIELSSFKIKKDIGKIKNPLIILTVGRLNWIKDYETAVSVMKDLKDSGINFIYNIAGTGNEIERLKFAVYTAGLEQNVKFLGKLDHTEINVKMDEADIYLQTSIEEGFCVSVLEAQAKGLLCVVSDAEGLKENVKDGVTGWIVPKRKPKMFSDKIIEIIQMAEEERKTIAMNARKRIEEEFKLEDQKNKFKKFFLD